MRLRLVETDERLDSDMAVDLVTRFKWRADRLRHVMGMTEFRWVVECEPRSVTRRGRVRDQWVVVAKLNLLEPADDDNDDGIAPIAVDEGR